MSGKKTKTETLRDLDLIRVFRSGVVVAWDRDENGDYREVRELRVEQFRNPEFAAKLEEIGLRRSPAGDLYVQGIPAGWWRWEEMLPALRQIYEPLAVFFGAIAAPVAVDELGESAAVG